MRWQAPEAEPAPRPVPISRRLPASVRVLPSAEVYARHGAGADPDPSTKAGMRAIIRATKAHLDAYPGDIHAALAEAKAYGGYRPEPPPRVWPYEMPEAQAAGMF